VQPHKPCGNIYLGRKEAGIMYRVSKLLTMSEKHKNSGTQFGKKTNGRLLIYSKLIPLYGESYVL
jgi:hypothetical protein